MSAKVELTWVYDRGIASKLEAAVTGCFAGRPDADDWIVSITSIGLICYRVVVQRIGLRRERLFFDSEQIVDEITGWVGLYLPARDAGSSTDSVSAR